MPHAEGMPEDLAAVETAEVTAANVLEKDEAIAGVIGDTDEKLADLKKEVLQAA